MTSDYYAPKRYVSLQNQQHPVPHGHYVPPRYRPHHHGSRTCGCLRCCCCFFGLCRCCICIILIFILLFVIIVATIYYFVKPHVPTYNVENLEIKAFDFKGNKLLSTIAIVVKAENPNEYVGFNYLENQVSIMYSESQICSGNFPPFEQPGKNTTTINVVLNGESDFGPEIQQDLLQDQKMGHIPLLIMVKVPVRLVVDDFIHLSRFVVHLNCSLVIDQLQPNKKPTILKKEFSYGMDFWLMVVFLFFTWKLESLYTYIYVCFV